MRQPQSVQRKEFVDSVLASATWLLANIAAVDFTQQLKETEYKPNEHLSPYWSRVEITFKNLEKHVPEDDFIQILCELLVCRHVDAFGFYLSNILTRLFTDRPETLRDSESIKARDILDCADMKEVIRRLAANRVHALSYRSLDDIIKYLSEQFNLEIKFDEENFNRTRELLEVRNIIVHNNGKINRLFLARTRRKDLTEEASFPLTVKYATSAGTSLLNVVDAIDSSIIKHFKL